MKPEDKTYLALIQQPTEESITLIKSQQAAIPHLTVSMHPVPKGTKEQQIMYSAYKNCVKLENSNPSMKDLGLQVFAGWATMLGIQIGPQDLNVAYDFTIQSFPELNLYDLAQAIILFVGRKLKTVEEDFIKPSISPIYVGKVLTKYIPYKQQLINEAKDKIARLNVHDVTKITPEQRLNIFKAVLVVAFKDSLQDKMYDDLGDSIYSFIKNNNLIEIDDALKKEAMDHATRQFTTTSEAHANKMEKMKIVNNGFLPQENFRASSKDQKNKLYRTYIVNVWLKKMHEHIKLSKEDFPKIKGATFAESFKKQALYIKKSEEIDIFIQSVTIEMLSFENYFTK